MSDHLFALRLFVRVARMGSFSLAARESKIPQSTTSRTIAALERDIGTALLVRTTRAVTPTDAGAEFLARIEPILALLDEAEHVARGTGELRGMLRVGLGTSLAVRAVIPHLSNFMTQHPALQIDLMIEDQRQHLVTDAVDVAFRFGILEDSSAVARKVRTWPRVLAASPCYLDKAGVPIIPADLAEHAIIIGPANLGTAWSFQKEGTVSSIEVEGQLRVRASEGVIAAAVAGLGITMSPYGACQKELETGKLVRLLPDWDAGTVELNALFAGGKAAKPAAWALTEHLIRVIQNL